ncbi:MAG: YfhO family protein, partial [Endomicrobium sp.]|nr:YfhO family protein [Endomicrobium sp.]
MNEFNDLTQAKKDKQKRTNYYLAYSALFLMTAYLVYSWFLKYGFAIILDSDGIKQSFSTFLYLGKYLRLIFTNLIHLNFTIPLWDHNIGYGADIISTLHYYGIGDPLNFLSFFTPQSWSELVYELIMISRLYFAGLFFMAYCFKMKTDYMPALIAAFIYVFSGFTFVGSLWLITGFMSAMIYLPMTLIGLEKILQGEKPHFFIISVFIALITNFYLFYMLSCFIFLYFIVRAPFVFREHSPNSPILVQVKAFFKGAGLKNSLKCFIRFCINYAIGCFMACIIFIPDFFLLIHSTRMKVSVFRWFYDNTYYRELLMSLFNIYPLSFEWIFIGICYLSLFAVILLFLKGKNFTQIKIIFAVLVLCLIFPLGGKIIHGFSYASIRWVWAFNFFMAFTAAAMMPFLVRIKTKEIIILTAITALYIAGCVYLYRNILNIVLYGYLIALIFLLVLFAVSKLKINKFLAYILIFVIVFLNILLGAFYSYRYNFGTYKVKIGEILPSITRTSHNSVKNIKDTDSFYRYEENPFGLDIYTNSSMLVGVKGTSYYFSLAVPYIYEWLGGLEHYTEFDFMYYGLDGRTMMNALASVKYFISADGAEVYKPYGFNKKAGSFKAHRRMLYHAYETKNTLPLGYTYSNYVPHSVYEELNAVQRQEIMMQTVVLKENLPSDFVQARNLTLREIRIPFYPMASDGVVLENNKFVVLKAGGGIQIGFNAPPNSETYLR